MTNQAPALPVARTTLRVLIVLNWMVGSLIFALLALSFLAEGWARRALGVGSVAGHNGIVLGIRPKRGHPHPGDKRSLIPEDPGAASRETIRV